MGLILLTSLNLWRWTCQNNLQSNYTISEVLEQQTTIPKVYSPSSKNDIRNISGIHFVSKLYESFIKCLALSFVNPFLDPGQCGRLNGCSISRYIIKLLHLFYFNLDKTNDSASLGKFVVRVV